MSGVYGAHQNFQQKMAMFGQQKQFNNFQAPNNINNNMNAPYEVNRNVMKPQMKSGGKSPKKQRRKKLVKSKAARAMGRNEDAIKVNLDSVRTKVKFGRLVVYSVNCLANLAENRFNCEFILEQGGIQALKDAMKNHPGNPAVMKEVSRTLANVARANPEFAMRMAQNGILDQCLSILKTHPNECGTFALTIMDAILKHVPQPQLIEQQIVQNGGLQILESALVNNSKNGDLCAGIVNHMNNLMNVDPQLVNTFGQRRLWEPILAAMKANPQHEQLAIAGTKVLTKMAVANQSNLQGIRGCDAVGIISGCMQANPDSKALISSGAGALKLLAGQNDVSRALAVLMDFGRYDDIVITQALGLLANLALIEENAHFIVTNGGFNALMSLISFKCKKTDLSPEEVAVVANATRALGRLLINPQVGQQFVRNGGIQILQRMMEYYDQEETIMNAAIDAAGNMSGNPAGKEVLMGSGILETATNVICKHAEYDVFMQKYGDILGNMPLDDPMFIKKMTDAGLLKAIQASLLANYENEDTVMAIMDLIKNLVTVQPELSQGLANANARGLIQAIRANHDNPLVLTKILGAVKAMAIADAASLEYLKKIGLEDELKKILKQENVSDETAAVIKLFLDDLQANEVPVDLTQVLLGLKGLGMPLDQLTKSYQEVEVHEEPQVEEIDPNAVLNQLRNLNALLADPNYAKSYISQGNVGHILDNIQQCYDDPNVVVAALDAIISCARVPGVFPLLEEAGVCEGVVQCMLEHPDNATVQYKGVCALGALAAHNDPLVTESLCQPITLDTALKALQLDIDNPNMAMAFADMVCYLMDDQTNAASTAQALASAGILDALNDLCHRYEHNPNVLSKCNEALSKINPYLFNPNDVGLHDANVNPYGTITLAQMAKLEPEQLDEMMHEYDTATLMTTLRASRDPRMVQSSAKEVNQRLQGGDDEVYQSAISGGGIGDLLGQAHHNMDNVGPLSACLDGIGTLSSDERLKTLLGMHGTIRLILECMRRHPNDIELLDKCCYILSNLSFNNAQNMTAIIELGGVQDIVGVIKKHTPVNFICESAVNVLVNLCHNSDKNKTLIARSGGAKACIAALRTHNKCLNDGDEAVVVACFRCLANLAYVADNTKQLIKLDTVAVVMDTMNQNTDKKDLIQMGVVVLANLSSHERTAARMVHLGVLDLILRVSESYPDELEIQRSCLGCIGNLMNDQANAVAFMDKNGHKRIFEIMQELVFEETVVCVAMKLLKVLATNSDIATELTLDGGCKVVAEVMVENKSNEDILSLGCQALCKLITTIEAARHVAKEGLVEVLVDVIKDNNNWANITVMNEAMKVVVNFSSVEENAQPFARAGAVPLLRSIEAHATNAVFLNNAAMALSKLSVHPASSRPLVKRGAVAVILSSMQKNPQRKGILTRYTRALTNLLYTEHKAGEELAKLNGFAIVQQLAEQHLTHAAFQQEFKGFEKAVKLKSRTYIPHEHKNQKTPRDLMDMSNVRFLCAGTIVRKYDNKGKAKKRTVKLNDDCSLLLFEDPGGKKAPKQLNMRSIKGVIAGPQADGMKKANPENSFVVVSIDPNGREFRMGLECKSQVEAKRWVKGLEDAISASQHT